jgi:hypothetical protein
MTLTERKEFVRNWSYSRDMCALDLAFECHVSEQTAHHWLNHGPPMSTVRLLMVLGELDS